MTDMSQWTVILVDDEPDSLNLLYDILQYNRVTVHRAANGRECLALLDEVTPTLVIVDLAMPHPDGWDILSAIRGRSSTADLPVVAVTAYHSGSVAAQARQAGFNAFFPKPIKAGEFLERLRAVAP